MNNHMELTMLGTGNAIATECYNTCFVLSDSGRYFMVDGGGGNGVLHQLKAGGLNWMDMRDIFVTHKHLDHFMGAVWMVRMICQFMSQGKYEGEARIYAHDEVIRLLRQAAHDLLTEKQSAFVDDRLKLIEVHDGEEREIIGHRVVFFDIRSTKAKQFGFSFDIGNGEMLTCCGDETYNESERTYTENSKWLLHEAFCLYADRERFKPYEKHHSTVTDACRIAETLNCRNLVLYHTEDTNLADRKRLYTEEGQRFYSGRLWVPEDLETIEL